MRVGVLVLVVALAGCGRPGKDSVFSQNPVAPRPVVHDTVWVHVPCPKCPCDSDGHRKD